MPQLFHILLYPCFTVFSASGGNIMTNSESSYSYVVYYNALFMNWNHDWAVFAFSKSSSTASEGFCEIRENTSIKMQEITNAGSSS